MRVAFFGTSEFAVPALRALVERGHQVGPVVTAPARPSGRGRKLVPSPVEEEARALGLAILAPEDPNDDAFLKDLAAHRPDVAVLAAYGCILKAPLLRLPPRGFLNIHPSLLPSYRGAAPIQRAVLAGEHETGVTIIVLSEQVDAGDIVKQVTVAIGPDETAGELSHRLAATGARLVLEALTRLEKDTGSRTPQDAGLATRAPKIGKSERNIDWREAAQRIHNRIRALSPEPGAVTSFRERRIVLLRSRLHETPEHGEPGLLLLQHQGLLVATGGGAIEIAELKPEGSRVQTGADFRNGHRPVPGERLVSAS
ncbi:MAG: methionyl-tRNA formyltransferase [candidate division WOR-3 bacterium]|nr:methionyl-tRNA formyltransferase [candidate division WOR-3 bacterium]